MFLSICLTLSLESISGLSLTTFVCLWLGSSWRTHWRQHIDDDESSSTSAAVFFDGGDDMGDVEDEFSSSSPSSTC